MQAARYFNTSPMELERSGERDFWLVRMTQFHEAERLAQEIKADIEKKRNNGNTSIRSNKNSDAGAAQSGTGAPANGR